MTSFYQWNRHGSDVWDSGPMLSCSGCASLRFSFPFHCMNKDDTVAPAGGATKEKSGALDHHMGAE